MVLTAPNLADIQHTEGKSIAPRTCTQMPEKLVFRERRARPVIDLEEVSLMIEFNGFGVFVLSPNSAVRVRPGLSAWIRGGMQETLTDEKQGQADKQVILPRDCCCEGTP